MNDDDGEDINPSDGGDCGYSDNGPPTPWLQVEEMTRRVAWILRGWKIQVLVIQITTGLVTLHMIILSSFYFKIAISSNIINSSQQSLWLKSENLQQWYQSPWFSQHQAQNAAAMTGISQFWKLRIEQ